MLSGQQESKSPYLESLPTWLELDYHQRVRALRRRRKWVTLGVVVVSIVGVAWTLLPGQEAAHQAGPVSTAHGMFAQDCGRCHTESWQPIQRLVGGDAVRSVPDRTCVVCHDGPIHQVQQEHEPACATCHREHRGNAVLARLDDGHCTACHHDLKRKDGKASDFASHIHAFAVDHPEFRAKVKDKDEAKIKFNHAHHLGLDLKSLRDKERGGLEHYGDRLQCVACHQPDQQQRYMLPIHYETHCAACHPLWVSVAGQFADPALGKAAEEFRRIPAPHKEPAVVRAVLRDRYLDFVQRNAVVPADPRPLPRPLPGRTDTAVTEQQWLWVKSQLAKVDEQLFVAQQLPAAERGIFGAGCRHCHFEKDPSRVREAGELPSYLKTDIPQRWFKHASFRHDSHRELQCLACHEQAATSTKTSDVLLPGIASCQKCHNPAAGARSDCAECHTYHDRTKDRGFDGPLTIQGSLK